MTVQAYGNENAFNMQSNVSNQISEVGQIRASFSLMKFLTKDLSRNAIKNE